MRIMLKSISTIFLSLALSVSAFASPIDITSYAVMVPQTITTLGQDDNSDVTAADYVAATPYVVDLAVATPVPIELTTELVVFTSEDTDNTAKEQNTNFERWYN